MVSLIQPNSPQITTQVPPIKVDGQRWALKLNASLDIREVLNTFFSGLIQQVPITSLCYTNDEKKIRLELGAAKLHSAKYGLKTNGYQLGSIIFTRSERFSGSELKVLENALLHLFYPLRNALLYKEAVDSSLRDPLTGLSNRAAFELAIKRELGMAKRHNQPLSMIVVDIDHFKTVNDTSGHQAGDALLTHVAQMLKATLRETDQVFRFGGEEFIILLANANLAAAHRVAERARKSIANSNITANNHIIGATVSMGISACSSEDERNTLFERADEALYLAKRSGRNCIKTEWDLINITAIAEQSIWQ